MVLYAQQADFVLHFKPVFQGKELVLNKYYQLQDGDSIIFSTFRFYITGIVTCDVNDKRLVHEENSYHLLDMEDTSTMRIKLSHVTKIGCLSFRVGVDSEKSVSGAMGGDLDPEKGMYWAWQSGYINFKIEGKQPKVPARNHEFQYHVGGYAGKDKAIQKVTTIIEASNEQTIYIQLDKFFEDMDMREQYSIMIPGEEAVQLAKKFAGCFQIQ
jgi:hypothetical protein